MKPRAIQRRLRPALAVAEAGSVPWVDRGALFVAVSVSGGVWPPPPPGAGRSLVVRGLSRCRYR
jgi:hypothetical protein